MWVRIKNEFINISKAKRIFKIPGAIVISFGFFENGSEECINVPFGNNAERDSAFEELGYLVGERGIV